MKIGEDYIGVGGGILIFNQKEEILLLKRGIKSKNEVGLWQTRDGDEGKYIVTITATDGDLIVKEYVLVTVYPRNKGPIIECPEIITVIETELVSLDCNVYDTEGDMFTLTYSGWLDTDKYQSTFNDAGEYTVLVTASDNENNSVTKEVKIVIRDKNRLPVVYGVEDIEAVEYDIIVLDISAFDDDDNEVSIVYAPPFDEDGVWVTTDGDAGAYASYVKVNDGIGTITEKFNIFIEHINTRPYLAPITPIVIDEGEPVEIVVDVSDGEEDDLTIGFTGWMTSDNYTTTYDDAGEHYVKVTVSDGQLETSQNVKITVNNINRPPVFVVPG
jgi:hypothetical protein